MVGLEYLIEATKMPQDWLELDIQNPHEIIQNSDKPEYRQRSSQLAFLFYQLFQKESQKIPEIINLWKQQSLSDDLPEVRNIWFGYH